MSCIVGRADRRAGLGTVHGHRLRHTAASGTLNAGASLDEVAQLLRHEGVASTVIHTQVELSRADRPGEALGLARLTRPARATYDDRRLGRGAGSVNAD